MKKLLTTEQAKEYFGVRDTRTIKKFINQGLKYFPVGTKDYRFDMKDILEFVEMQKQIAQMEKIKEIPMKKKVKHKTIDLQKRRINLEFNRVI